ncbi:MAG TPA: SsrA-binding protein SmpB [Chloroflexota bacterium]|nr:SsrA-binding protein SmpB [Chloroflexota bacterium]
MPRKAGRPAESSRDKDNTSVSRNREALHDYAVEDRFEAGIALTGSEIKSIRTSGRVSLREGFVRVKDGEAWLEGVHIAPYEHGTYLNHEPSRPRKLLLHKQELRQLGMKTQASGYTVIPLHLYLKNGRAKVEVGLARGRRHYDKRQAIAERESKREMARQLRGHD